MRNNDISNTSKPDMLFRLDGFLVVRRKINFFGKIVSLFIGEEASYELDFRVVKAIWDTHRFTDYRVSVCCKIPMYNKYSSKIKQQLDKLPIASIVHFDSDSTIRNRIFENEYTYYVDDNESTRSFVHYKYAVSLEQYYNAVKMERRR